MSKFSGMIGYGMDGEIVDGVWSPEIVERHYYGDVIENIAKQDATEYLNDDIALQNQISILADPYAYQNFASIKYIEYMGVRWKVKSIRVQRPRLILTIGGVYNEH